MSDSAAAEFLRCIIASKDEFLAAVLEAYESYISRGERLISLDSLLREPQATILSMEDFRQRHTDYAHQLESEAKSLMGNCPEGLKHHSIHTISNTANIPSVIGITMTQFHILFSVLEKELKMLYPKCPSTLEPGENSIYCENRLKLFMSLYRLKMGCSFRHMEVMFGWDHHSIMDWFQIVIHLLSKTLSPFHVNIMDTLGPKWVEEQTGLWKIHAIENHSFEKYVERLNVHNNKNRTMISPTDDNSLKGSIGAVDGTFTVRCRVSAKQYRESGQDPTKDVMYSEYIKSHAWKLSVITSHALGQYQQLILNVSVHVGSTSDTAAYSFAQMPEFRNFLPPGVFLHGDSAYFSDLFVMPPYASTTIENAEPSKQTSMRAFNHVHSQDRCCAEHGIAFLKQWGIVRGRSDIQLFTKGEFYRTCVNVCWGLHNFFVIHSLVGSK